MSSAFQELEHLLQSNLGSFATNVEQAVGKFPLSRGWIEAELATGSQLKAAALLNGAKVALLEAGAAWATGLNRAAASSARTFAENVMAWIYYKDHSVEYNLVEQRKSDLLLPKAVQSYIKSVDHGFDAAYKFLNESKTRPNEYFYSDLSYYIHAHPNQIISGKEAHELVVTNPPESAFLQICSHLDEFISDNFVAFYRHSWGFLPQIVVENIQTRLSMKLSKFIAVP